MGDILEELTGRLQVEGEGGRGPSLIQSARIRTRSQRQVEHGLVDRPIPGGTVARPEPLLAFRLQA